MDEICRMVKEKKILFPYKRHFITLEDLLRNFDLLKSYRFQTSSTPFIIGHLPQLTADKLVFHYDHGVSIPLLLKCKQEDYFKYQIMSDYFQEEARMQAQRFDAECCPYDYWLKYPEQIFNHALKRRKKADHRREYYTKYSKGLGDILADTALQTPLASLDIPQEFFSLTPYELRESIYEIKSPGEATQFRPTLMVEFVKRFDRHRVLDMCAGWGDRLIGAMAVGVEFYCGVDPFIALHKNYQKIIETFLPLLSEIPHKAMFDCVMPPVPRFHMIQAPFQEANIPSAEYDLIFSSPPYFDLEIYSDEETQSHKLGSFDKWYSKFLILSLQKAWSFLHNEGLCCVVLNDIKGKPDFTLRMVADVTKFPGAIYKGVIGYLAPRKTHPQPIWIWKKELPSSNKV